MEEQQSDFRPLIVRLLASGKLTPEGLIELISKGLIDPGLLFSKFMAAYTLFWLMPDGVRSGSRRPSAATEKTFDLLWLAYEQWIARGVTHLSEAAGLWTDFYGNIRWAIVQRRGDEELERDLHKHIAKSAHVWLSEVDKLTTKNFGHFRNEISKIVDALKKIEKIGEATTDVSSNVHHRQEVTGINESPEWTQRDMQRS